MTLRSSLLISTAAILSAALVQCHPQNTGSGVEYSRFPASGGGIPQPRYDDYVADPLRSPSTINGFTSPPVNFAEPNRLATTDNPAQYIPVQSITQPLTGCAADTKYFEVGQQYDKPGECMMRVCQGSNTWLSKECGPEQVPGDKTLGWPSCCTNVYAIRPIVGNI